MEPEKWTVGMMVQAGMVMQMYLQQYFEERGLLYPVDPNDALLFFISEVGELTDAIVQGNGAWVRNNPDKHAEDSIAEEAGDVLMMFLVWCEIMGINPVADMLIKCERKLEATKENKNA
jgi:NTP pyrophosphatase (non-canonical NTP hydrolase)